MRRIILSALSLLLLALVASPVSADHSWGNYHWGRTANLFNLKVGENLTSSWEPYLTTTANDWSPSSVLDMTVVPGSTTARRCKAKSGQVEACNSSYGNNGWLGIAQIWVSGSHISQGITKLNDTYFNTVKYNSSAWRNLVMCQEVGHNLGLDHQDENFANPPLGTCMDYSDNPSLNQHPNGHDYEQLESIYAHLDLISTISQSVPSIANGNFEDRSEWGREHKNNGRVALYERDFGRGQKLFTFVIWAN